MAVMAALLLTLPLELSAFPRRDALPLRRSVVKIYTTFQRENYATPWQPNPPAQATGSGFLIRGRRLLTNAHVVSDTRFLEVQKDGDPARFPATVLYVAHDCDLAILTVEDASFYENMVVTELSDAVPRLSDQVAVLGYPMGGTRLSLTRGVVSRVDFGVYAHSGVDAHLVIQVDAAINPGNSGGPVIRDDRVIGVAFQGLGGADNIGYAIPMPVIRRFLTDVEDATYDGYVELGITPFPLRNPALRDSLRLPASLSGVAVAAVDPFGSGSGILVDGDVLLALDGRNIEDDGSIVLDGHPTEFAELLERKQAGDPALFDVWRNGEPISLSVPMRRVEDPFLFRNEYDRQPRFRAVGGLVFSPLSRGYLRTLGSDLTDDAAFPLMYLSAFAKADGLWRDRDEFVVLARRLPHPVNAFTESFVHRTLRQVNGVSIRRLEDMDEALACGTNRFDVFVFDGRDVPLLLDAQATRLADPDIRRIYNLPEPADAMP